MYDEALFREYLELPYNNEIGIFKPRRKISNLYHSSSNRQSAKYMQEKVLIIVRMMNKAMVILLLHIKRSLSLTMQTSGTGTFKTCSKAERVQKLRKQSKLWILYNPNSSPSIWNTFAMKP